MGTRDFITPADPEYGWTDEKIAFAVMRSSYVPDMAALIPKRGPSDAGRPNLYPDHVYILYMGLVPRAFRSLRRAAAWMGDPMTWYRIRSHARRNWDIELPDLPPARTTLYYNFNRLTKYGEQLREAFALLAIKQAQEQDCLVEGPDTEVKPERRNTVVADGTVPKPRFLKKTYERLLSEGKVSEIPTRHIEGGEPDGEEDWDLADSDEPTDGNETDAPRRKKPNWVYGNKEFVMSIRPDDHPNSYLVLGCFGVPVQGYGGEAGIAVDRFKKLRGVTSGFRGVRYDGAFRGTHIDAVMKAGISPIAPVPKNDIRRFHIEVTCKCSIPHKLFTEGGDIVELEILDDGTGHPQPCSRLKQYTRKNANGTYRWYADIQLSCGCKHSERLDCMDEDARNRTQLIRLHPPESDEYKNTYGWRAHIESVNNTLDTSLYRHRMIVDTRERQALIMIGFAIGSNAISAAVHAARLKAGHFADPPDQAKAA
ncbi:hypothetical protein AAIH25_02135 [Arthrobacter crystallopoietes]|uniref:hypothetical protein n=1 Tax=Crystallibacter crystallopoietes TaxID=37928 RepID=UPI003D24DE97